MLNVNIKETNLEFATELWERPYTDMIVIHHTGSKHDTDFSAAQIHEFHLNKYWAGIGYHFVIRKDGTIERGRPEWAIGSHAYGDNDHSLGIHLSGDFNAAEPTTEQIEMCSMLCAYLCDKYDISTDRQHIVGHGELDDQVTPVGCPGKNLFNLLDTISGKANWYRYGAQEVKNHIPAEVKPDSITVEILSDKPILQETVETVKDIFRKSNCPNESLLNSIPAFAAFDGKYTIHLGNANSNDYNITIVI